MVLNPSDLVLDSGLEKIPVYDAANLILDAKRLGVILSGAVSIDCDVSVYSVSGDLILTHAVRQGGWSKEVDGKKVFVLASDNGGRKWKPDVQLNVGDIIRPSQFSGFVYRVTKAGSSGSAEPHWWYPSVYVSGGIGSAVADVVEYSKPSCHGIIGE